MQLVAFKVQRFRSLYETGWIRFFDLTLLTGENDGGKSSTLYALQLFLSPQGQPADDDFSYADPDDDQVRHKDIEMWAQLTLNELDQALLSKHVGMCADNIEISRKFTQDKGTAPFTLLAPGHADPRFRRSLDAYTVSELRSLADEYSVTMPKQAAKQAVVQVLREWLDTQPKELAAIELPAELCARLPKVEMFSSESAANPDDEIKRALTIQFRALLNNARYSGPIRELVGKIEEDLNNEVDKLLPMVQRYCRDVEQVSVKPSFNFANGLSATQMQLHRRTGGPVLLERSGAGQRRRISLAVYEWQLSLLQNRTEESDPLIMAFDEPDTHLDYNAQRQIFDLIKQFAELPAVQVLVATHSLNMLERVPIDRIVHYTLGEQRRTNCSCFEAADEDKHELVNMFMYRISENLGLRNSIMLHERCFLLVEGPTEMAALPVLFYLKYQMSLQTAGICLLNGENNLGARRFARFLHKNRRSVLFLVDTDCKYESSVKREFTQASLLADAIDEATQVHYAGTLEFEDAFPDALWAAMAQKYYPKQDGSTWTPEEFGALRPSRKFSKEVQDLLKQGRHRLPGKPELGYQLATTLEKADEIPADIARCFECAYQIANRS